MLDHVFISVANLNHSIEFYERVLVTLGINHVLSGVADNMNVDCLLPDFIANAAHA